MLKTSRPAPNVISIHLTRDECFNRRIDNESVGLCERWEETGGLSTMDTPEPPNGDPRCPDIHTRRVSTVKPMSLQATVYPAIRTGRWSYNPLETSIGFVVFH